MFAGKLFPFAFITIACGAISGFHSLISSGTTPKLIRRETEIRLVGYGAMVAESMVAIMATIAACVLEPGTYFAINSPAGIAGQLPEKAASTISGWGFPVTAAGMQALAQSVGEQTLFNRTGGAPAFAVGMAHIFSSSLGGQAVMALWYHFALMFEALIHSDRARCGHAGRTLHGARRAWACVETAGQNELVSVGAGYQRTHCRRLGIFPLAGGARSSWRNQFTVAAVRDR